MALLLSWALGPAVAAEAVEAGSQNLRALEAAVIRTLQTERVPGAAVVVIEGGRVVLALDFGVADLATGQKVTPETVFRAGSISKTFTAMAALALVEEGRLSLNMPMAQLLPEWAHDNPWAKSHPVRLGHLLEHSAGLDDIRYRHYLLDSATLPLNQALPAFGPYAVRWQPGAGTSYSNAGPVVAGRAIELAAGTDFVRFMTERISAPLGMNSARWTRSPDIAQRLSKSYGSDLRTPEPFVDTPARPSGSLNISARDLALLPRMLLGRGTLDGVQVLRPEAVLRMETPMTRAEALAPNPGLGWGLGLQPDAKGRTVFYGHDGSIDGFVARFAYSPALNAGYVVMVNALSEAPLTVAAQVREYLERDAAPPALRGEPVSAAERAAWAGQYQSITPRQELLRALLGLTQWEGASFEGDVLRYGGQRWLHQGKGVFRAEGAAVAGLVLSPAPATWYSGGMLAHTPDGTRRRVPSWEAAIKLGATGAYVLSLALSLLLLPFVLWAARPSRRRAPLYLGAARSGASLRFFPVAALWVAASVPIGVLVLLGSGDLALLGQPTLAGWAVAGLGLVAPLLWLAAAITVWRAPSAPWLRLAGAWQLVLAALLLGWLAAHGWLGMRIWY
jgi:CubicO group peptidase (beta-lactamase class C family)